MASPKGEYTPKSGYFAGQTFSSYYRYQVARAQSLGFRSYTTERTYLRDPVAMKLESRMRATLGISRNQARARVREAGVNRGSSGGRVVAWAIDQGLFDYGDDAADYIYYE